MGLVPSKQEEEAPGLLMQCADTEMVSHLQARMTESAQDEGPPGPESAQDEGPCRN